MHEPTIPGRVQWPQGSAGRFKTLFLPVEEFPRFVNKKFTVIAQRCGVTAGAMLGTVQFPEDGEL
jgi:hypothetical protein